MNDDGRNEPEDFLDLVPQSRKGRLKVYLGGAAGVGKTYRMLEEAHQLRQQGHDVVLGFVETHGRAETAARVGDLELVPLREIPYRGVTLEEMDVDAILARKPEVAIVDELAHTNASGSRHNKRYQDVEELIANGINVITAFNIQHLESLNQMVRRITGVDIRETVPDTFLAQADQVVDRRYHGRGTAPAPARRQDLSARSRRAGPQEFLQAEQSRRRCANWRCAKSRAIRAASARSSSCSSARADAAPPSPSA